MCVAWPRVTSLGAGGLDRSDEDTLQPIGRIRGGGILALALCLLAWDAVLAFGQATPTPPAAKPATAGATPPKPAGPPAADVQEAKPEVYYVRDKEGQLVPVPDFTYEQFKRLYDLEQKLAQNSAPPSYVLQSLQVTGAAVDDVADLEVRVRWVIRSTAWVRIPLRLVGGVLKDVPTYDGPGEQFVEAERGGGFAVWVHEVDPTPHTLTLKLRAPLKRQGDEQQIQLPCPTATLSELALTVPLPRVAASLGGGGSLLSNESPRPGVTQLKAAGLGDSFQLAWRPRETNGTRLLGAVEATSAITVRVEGPRRVTSEARIKLRGLGPGVDSLRVRLPAGMDFIPSLEPGFTATVVETLPASAAGRGAQVVEVRPDARGATTADIHLRATTSEAVKGGSGEWLEAIGYEVLGVVRQPGYAEFVIDGEWSLQYGERQAAQPAELTEAARQQGVVSRFEFPRQPASLLIQVQPRKSRVTVEPTYVMTVGTTQARLQANFNYRFSGAAASRLQVDCGAWIVDRVEPERFAMHVATRPEEPGLLTITWPGDAGPPAKDFELQIFGHLNVAPDQPLTLPIPRPVLDGSSTATIVVAPEDNVALAPRAAELVGLVAEPLPPTGLANPRLQPPLYYRARLDAEPRKFVADVRPRPRAMSVELWHALRVAEEEVRAEHRMRYVVVNEPASRIQVALGRTEGATPRLQFFLDAGAPPLVPLVAREADPGDEIAGRQWELQLPESRIGEFVIVARTTWSCGAQDGRTSREVSIPLLTPVAADDTTVVRNRLYLSAEEPWRAELIRQDWRATEAAADDARDARRAFPGEVCYTGPDTAASVTLRRGRSGGSAAPVWVRQAWVQTWLARGVRHDRAVWKLTSRENRVEVQLPPDVDPADVIVAVDGVETEVDAAAAGRLRVPVEGQGNEQVVEVSMLSARPISVAGVTRVDLPRLLHGHGAPRFLWQLVMPGDEHLLVAPAALSPESVWGWRNGVWERQGAWGQAELERWSGASAQDDLPRETNQYLFSTVGAPDAIEVRLAPRSVLVTVASAVMLFVGLSWLYFPVFRHPALLALFACVLIGLSFAQPDAAVACAQAALLGWALSLLARLLQGVTGRRAAPVAARAPRSSIARSPADQRFETQEAPSPATTATAGPFLPTAAPKA